MITIEDLLRPDPRWREYASMPEMDPLTQDGALQEAQLLEVRFDALRSTVGLLFEMRGALQLREANTGVLVARGVRTLSWSSAPRSTSLTAWTVGDSVTSGWTGGFRLELGLWPAPGTELMLAAESAAFFSVEVPGIGDVPDYGADDDVIRAHLPSWRSEFHPIRAVFLDPARPTMTWPVS